MPCFIFLTQLTNLPGYSDHGCTQSWSSPLPLGSGNYTTPKLLLLFLLQLSHMTIWGSILSWFVFLPIYAQVWYVYITTYSTPKILHTIVYRPTLPFGSEMTGLVRTNKTHVKYINYIFFYTYQDSRLFGSAVFYALIVLVPCIALAPDILYKM